MSFECLLNNLFSEYSLRADKLVLLGKLCEALSAGIATNFCAQTPFIQIPQYLPWLCGYQAIFSIFKQMII